jgi:aminomethyltransferase
MSRQNTLRDFHEAHGAAFCERDGWIVPLHYGDPRAEYDAVRQRIGLMDLSPRGLLQFTGADRVSFLQGMLSNDLRPLKTFDGQYAAILNQQGKILADVRVLCAMNSIYVDFRDELKARILEHLNRYLVADEVDIHDRSEEYALLSFQGPSAPALAGALAPGIQLPDQEAHHAMVGVEGSAVCIVRASHTGESGYDLIIPRPDVARVAEKLSETAAASGAKWVGQETLEVLRVEAGIPQYGIDMTEDNLLLETGLDNHVSFSKGCYLGQEIVERVRSRGHVNKKLRGLLIDGQAVAHHGDLIHAAEKHIGTVTSSVYSPALSRSIALGYLHREHWQSGTPVSIQTESALLSAEVSSLPFLKA